MPYIIICTFYLLLTIAFLFFLFYTWLCFVNQSIYLHSNLFHISLYLFPSFALSWLHQNLRSHSTNHFSVRSVSQVLFAFPVEFGTVIATIWSPIKISTALTNQVRSAPGRCRAARQNYPPRPSDVETSNVWMPNRWTINAGSVSHHIFMFNSMSSASSALFVFVFVFVSLSIRLPNPIHLDVDPGQPFPDHFPGPGWIDRFDYDRLLAAFGWGAHVLVPSTP